MGMFDPSFTPAAGTMGHLSGRLSANEKGPAEGATSPSHGRPYPKHETETDTPITTTGLTPAASASARLVAQWRGQYPEEAAAISRMSIGELLVAAAGLTAAGDGFLAIINQPRCKAGGPAGRWLQDELDRVTCIRDIVMAELEARPVTPDHDGEQRMRVLIAFDILDCGEDVFETMAKAARLKSELESARATAGRRRAAS